jgi:hypothetical protein
VASTGLKFQVVTRDNLLNFLFPHHHIPITKKGAIFRKMLEVFGDQLASLTGNSEHESEAEVKPTGNLSHGKTKDEVSSIISNIVVETLRNSAEMPENNSQATFAEVGTFFLRFLPFLLMCHASSEWIRLSPATGEICYCRKRMGFTRKFDSNTNVNEIAESHSLHITVESFG